MRTLRGRPANLNYLGPNAQKKDKTSLSIFLRSEPLRLETSRFVGAFCLFSLLEIGCMLGRRLQFGASLSG